MKIVNYAAIGMPNEMHNNMLNYLIHAKDYQKHQYAAKVTFNDSWRITGISTKDDKNQLLGALVKTENNTQANRYLNRCLINQNHG